MTLHLLRSVMGMGFKVPGYRAHRLQVFPVKCVWTTGGSMSWQGTGEASSV